MYCFPENICRRVVTEGSNKSTGAMKQNNGRQRIPTADSCIATASKVKFVFSHSQLLLFDSELDSFRFSV